MTADDTLLTRTRQLMRRYDIKAKKGLGQNFLVDGQALEKILTAAQISDTDTIIEVGPGLGILTAELAARAGQVVAVELDGRLSAILKQELSRFENITIINRDVLASTPEALLREAGIDSGYRVVANLPYYITSAVLRHFLEAARKPASMVVMVQQEVAAEIAARPGKMSLLSIGVQLYGEAQIIDRVPAASFYPAPKVDSAILKVTPYTRPPVEIRDEAGFFSLARAGFSTARKQLANSLANGLGVSKTETTHLLEQADIEPSRRAETLTITEWGRLWHIYRGENS